MRSNPSSKQSTPRPIEIPSDLYPLILQHLSKRDLATCLRICRGFYIEYLPLLYRDITIDLGKPINPGLIKRKESIPPYRLRKTLKRISHGYNEDEYQARIRDLAEWERLRRETELEEMESGTGFLEGKKSEWLSLLLGRPVGYTPPFTIRRLNLTPPSFDYTTHLTLSPHSKSHCLEYKPLIMRNLITLRLISREGDRDPRPWTCHSRHDHIDVCNVERGCFCPLMAQLKPRRLIIGGYTDVEEYDRNALMGTWPSLPADAMIWLKEVVVHATGYGMIEFGPSHKHGFSEWGERYTAPPKLKLEKLTFVLESDNRWRHRHGIGDVPPEPMVDRWAPDMVWTRLAMALEGDIGEMEVVGMDGLDDTWSGMQKFEWDMEMVKKEMNKYLVSKGIQQQEAEKRVENVKFTDRYGRWGKRVYVQHVEVTEMAAIQGSDILDSW